MTVSRIERTELLLPGPAEALTRLLGVALPDLYGPEGLPLLWHWLYLLEHPAQQDLGADGHPVRGCIPAPPGPGRRRMWAGGRVWSRGPLLCAEPATRTTTVKDIREKTGRTGRLTFVTVQHDIVQRNALVVHEEQDIVYRDAAAKPSSPGAAAALPDGGEVSWEARPPGPDECFVETSATLLFRFSALTYNAHRIHYDRDYARDVEGYPGLVTHGPLQALAMTEAARAQDRWAPGRTHFEYRLVSPLFDFQGLVAGVERLGSEVATSVRDLSGRRTAHGVLSTA